MSPYQIFINQCPLDFISDYAEPVDDWIKKGIDDYEVPYGYSARFETALDRALAYNMALELLKDALKAEKEVIYSDLRHGPYVFKTLKDIELDDCGESVVAWFIFKEDNNGTTHKVGIID